MLSLFTLSSLFINNKHLWNFYLLKFLLNIRIKRRAILSWASIYTNSRCSLSTVCRESLRSNRRICWHSSSPLFETLRKDASASILDKHSLLRMEHGQRNHHCIYIRLGMHFDVSKTTLSSLLSGQRLCSSMILGALAITAVLAPGV